MPFYLFFRGRGRRLGPRHSPRLSDEEFFGRCGPPGAGRNGRPTVFLFMLFLFLFPASFFVASVAPLVPAEVAALSLLWPTVAYPAGGSCTPTPTS